MTNKSELNPIEVSTIWTEFKNNFDLNDEQLSKFKIYFDMLIANNKLFNITAITGLKEVVKDHFSDSLYISNFIDFTKINSISDIGSGGGFPGIPLKIKYPHLEVVLIEVTGKKIAFLQEVIQNLGLDKIQIYKYDWKTFLRKTDYKIDLFCARASLQPEDLVRVFSPAFKYQGSTLVYWASKLYEPSKKVLKYTQRQETYKIGQKIRKLIFFKNQPWE